MTKSTLYIHIGAPKTGSTLIQRHLEQRRDELRTFGLLYPDAGLRGFGHHDVAFLLDGGYPDWAKPQDEPLSTISERMKRECAAFQGDVLLSSEDFYLLPQPEKLRKWIDDYQLNDNRRIKLIVYIRRQDDLLVSWYNQMIKAQGFSGSFEDSLSQSLWLGDYASELDRWSSTFGTEALDVRCYDDASRAPGGLLKDFLSDVCSAAVDTLADASSDRINVSLNRDLLEIQKVINRLPITILEKRKFHQELMALTELEIDLFSKAPVIDGSQRRALMEKFEQGNCTVASSYFDKERLFDETQETMAAAVEYPGLDVEKVIAAFAWLLLHRK